SRPPGCTQAVAIGAGESRFLGAFSRRRRGEARRRPCRCRPRRACTTARDLPLRRATPPPLACPADRGRAGELAARCTDFRAGGRGAGEAGESQVGPSRRRRTHARRRPRADRMGWGKRAAVGAARSVEGAMTALCALLIRDMRLAVRVGGGAWIGVLFFL